MWLYILWADYYGAADYAIAYWLLLMVLDLPVSLLVYMLYWIVAEVALLPSWFEYNLLVPLLLLVLGGAQWAWVGWWLDDPASHRRTLAPCEHCGYDLRGSPGPRCPECGEYF